MKKKLIYIIILITLITSACSNQNKTDENVPEWYELTAVPKNKLESGMYYVKTKDNTGADIFYPVYLGTTMYNNPVIKVVDPRRVIKYTKNTEKIPRLYQEDELVYVSREKPPGIVVWERFKDRGYSTGMSDIFVNDTERLQIEKNPKKILSYSNAGEHFINFEDKTPIVIESIDGITLDSTRLSDINTITGLEKNKVYSMDTYIGTFLYNIDIVADTKYFQSWEIYASNVFEYTKEGYAVITIPEGLKPGYYNLNGMGLVCYMGETKRNDMNQEFIDFSVPGSEDNPNILLSTALQEIGEDIEDYEDMFYEDDDYESGKVYIETKDGEYEDFRFHIEVEPEKNIISPYWSLVPISAESVNLYVYENDSDEEYYSMSYNIETIEDTSGKERLAYDSNTKKLQFVIEIQNSDGTYYKEEKTVNLSKPPKIIFPEGEITNKPELEIKHSNFEGLLVTIYRDDYEIAIASFINEDTYKIDLVPEWNNITIKTNSPSVIFKWSKEVYYSEYEIIE